MGSWLFALQGRGAINDFVFKFIDSMRHTAFPCFIISSPQWVGFRWLFFVKLLSKPTKNWLHWFFLVMSFSRIDFQTVKTVLQFLRNWESDNSISSTGIWFTFESLLRTHCCLTESFCLKKQSPIVKSKTLSEFSVDLIASGRADGVFCSIFPQSSSVLAQKASRSAKEGKSVNSVQSSWTNP